MEYRWQYRDGKGRWLYLSGNGQSLDEQLRLGDDLIDCRDCDGHRLVVNDPDTGSGFYPIFYTLNSKPR